MVHKVLIPDSSKPCSDCKSRVIHDGLPWVAKRFFNIGTGEGQVEIQDNYDQITKEGAQLSKAGYFLERFIGEAKRQTVDIENGIILRSLSICSLLTTITFRNQSYVIWLFETRRSSPVKHWGGTNEYPAWYQNKLGSILNAFAHYVYLFSQESTVPADLQTATVVNENGEGVQVLFDIMTHTLNGLSSVGDHGKSGITGFLKKHECGNRCHNLRLSCDGFDCDEPSHEASENEA
ncbi:kinase-like domain-containing protein [Mycena olivaceomarginata]|nr:kinase-like domain-containing protein [Mycena olivaceomarginata]